jgi:predicted ATPase
MPANTLDFITIQGFKSIASVKVGLRPINIVIGSNGSGKSNFIGAFAFLREIEQGRLGAYVTASGGAEKVLHFGSKVTKELRLLLSFQDGTNGYELILEPTSDDGLFPSLETALVGHEAYPGPLPERLKAVRSGREAGISDPRGPIKRWVNSHVAASWRIYHLNDSSSSSPMRKTARVDDNRLLRADGSNLPSFLYFLKRQYLDFYLLIQRAVQQVAPFFEDFRLEPRHLESEDIKLEWRHKSSDQYFDASSLSDGTLRFMALATLFLQPETLRPSVILVDEPELGLHPYAIGMLASLIRQASVNTQVITATQSSLLLDHFSPEDVLVADRFEGGTQLKRLNSADLGGWLEDYSLGQLWEKNEFGGRPVPA